MLNTTALYMSLDWRIGDEVFYVLPKSNVQLSGVITGMGSTEIAHPTLGLVPIVILDIKVTYPDQTSVRVQHRMEYPELARPVPVSTVRSASDVGRRKRLAPRVYGNRKNSINRQQWISVGR